MPHDVKALIAKVGEEEFVRRLNDIFEKSRSKIFSGGTTIDAFAGLETYYNQAFRQIFRHNSRWETYSREVCGKRKIIRQVRIIMIV